MMSFYVVFLALAVTIGRCQETLNNAAADRSGALNTVSNDDATGAKLAIDNSIGAVVTDDKAGAVNAQRQVMANALNSDSLGSVPANAGGHVPDAVDGQGHMHNDGDADDDVIASEKRWANADSRVWGKRAVALSDVTRMDDDIDDTFVDAKRSWSSDNARVWGKRSDDVISAQKKWSDDDKSRLWGKRSDDHDDDDVISAQKKWSDDDKTRLWGKRDGGADVTVGGQQHAATLMDKKWDSQSRAWGKRSSLLSDDDDDQALSKKWDTGESRVWGKRSSLVGDDVRRWDAQSRVWGKREWGGNPARVWGKRDGGEIMDKALSGADVVDKRRWGQADRNWGKRTWGGSGREWGRRRKRSIYDVNLDDLDTLWFTNYKRRWGKRSSGSDGDDVKRAWNANERLWGKRSWDALGQRRIEWGKRFEPQPAHYSNLFASNDWWNQQK